MTVRYIDNGWRLDYDALLDMNTGEGWYWVHPGSGTYSKRYESEQDANDAMDNGLVTLEDD